MSAHNNHVENSTWTRAVMMAGLFLTIGIIAFAALGVGVANHKHEIYDEAKYEYYEAKEDPLANRTELKDLKEDYEKNTGIVIVKHFAENDINPYEIPGVIQLHHAPFTWGRSALKSLDNSIALETCAKMAIDSWKVSPELPVIPQYILDKHFLRKHGPDSYYGQESNDQEGP